MEKVKSYEFTKKSVFEFLEKKLNISSFVLDVFLRDLHNHIKPLYDDPEETIRYVYGVTDDRIRIRSYVDDTDCIRVVLNCSASGTTKFMITDERDQANKPGFIKPIDYAFYVSREELFG